MMKKCGVENDNDEKNGKLRRAGGENYERMI